MLVGAVIVHYQVQRHRAREFLVQAAQEFQELLMPVPGKALPGHPPLEHLQRGKQVGGTIRPLFHKPIKEDRPLIRPELHGSVNAGRVLISDAKTDGSLAGFQNTTGLFSGRTVFHS